MPKEENYMAILELTLKKFQSVEICAFENLTVCFLFIFSFCVSCLEYKALVDASDF